MDSRSFAEQGICPALHGDPDAPIRRAKCRPFTNGFSAGGQRHGSGRNSGYAGRCEVWAQFSRHGRILLHFVPYVWSSQIARHPGDGPDPNGETAEEKLVSSLFARSAVAATRHANADVLAGR